MAGHVLIQRLLGFNQEEIKQWLIALVDSRKCNGCPLKPGEDVENILDRRCQINVGAPLSLAIRLCSALIAGREYNRRQLVDWQKIPGILCP